MGNILPKKFHLKNEKIKIMIEGHSYVYSLITYDLLSISARSQAKSWRKSKGFSIAK